MLVQAAPTTTCWKNGGRCRQRAASAAKSIKRPTRGKRRATALRRQTQRCCLLGPHQNPSDHHAAAGRDVGSSSMSDCSSLARSFTPVQFSLSHHGMGHLDAALKSACAYAELVLIFWFSRLFVSVPGHPRNVNPHLAGARRHDAFGAVDSSRRRHSRAPRADDSVFCTMLLPFLDSMISCPIRSFSEIWLAWY